MKRLRNEKKNARSLKNKIIKTLLMIFVSIVIIFFILNYTGFFRVDIDKIKITGNIYYNNEEIKEIVLKDGDNSLYLMMRYNLMNKENVPFIEEIEISLKSHNIIEITVKEKDLFGYLRYMGMNLYFDKDGNLIESSNKIIKTVPLIENVEFEEIQIGKYIKVKNEDIFDILVYIKQAAKKYELNPDRIHLENNDKEIILTFDNVKVNIGSGEHIDEKMDRIKEILPRLKNKSGILHMEKYTNESKSISFIKDVDD